MVKISEILTLDLQEDIKNVIDLEDQSEIEIQQEIESYIVTEGIGRHIYNFTNIFTSNIKETGVWLSGFYGSGKSYFGKMLGYIIENPQINGTSARERFIPRLNGVADSSLIENVIRNLETVNSKVIFLDVAKQNTDKGLSFTLFANFLKYLGFREDIYGYMEFDLFIDGKLQEFKEKVKIKFSQEWNDLKKSNQQVAKIMNIVFLDMGYTEIQYQDTKNIYSTAIKDFSANKLKTELEKYLKRKPDETLVFIFDEASEAINQKKFTLLDLEGISEALSGISNKVWTIAIAQEKLDDVINNVNVKKAQLTKVTDRFKTKIHLEATEIDTIIRSRLLHKTEDSFKKLQDYYNNNEGLVSDATNLKSAFPTKTISADQFASYYPFHRYQFDVLQKFLFSSNALVSTQIAARGMIITAFDVLRKHKNINLYNFITGYDICSEAQMAPSVGLVNKYDTAKKILLEQNSVIDGEKLLKTIHILTDSEVIISTVENITKSYISDITTYYEVKPKIEESLEILVESKVLLLANNNYKITSDLEGKLLEEMKDIDIAPYRKKRFLIKYIKDNKIYNSIVNYNDGINSFKFSILSDQDDELASSGDKQLKLISYNLYNIEDNRQDFIEKLKIETQLHKDCMTLVPDNQKFYLIDKLIIDVSRYMEMEDKYANETDLIKRQIIRDFTLIREEKEKALIQLIEEAYYNSSLVYMFDEKLLNTDGFKSTVNEVQKRMIKNIYTKRLSSVMSEGLVQKIFNNSKDDLFRLFSVDDFKFFDKNGNFIGDNLKVVEEISCKITNRFIEGRILENELSLAPWGFSYGTIICTLAVLFRAGRLAVKYNGDTFYSHEEKSVQDAFFNATKFKSASFKFISTTLPTAKKNQVVQFLLDLDIESYSERKIDWNTNDFDIADYIQYIANIFINALKSLFNTVDDFESHFPIVANQKNVLLSYTAKTTESNYIDKVEFLINNEDIFRNAIQIIIKAQKFIKKDFSRVKEYKRFIEEVSEEIKKTGKIDANIITAHEEFMELYKKDMIKNYGLLQQPVQLVRDIYFQLIKNAAARMSQEYMKLAGLVDQADKELKGYPSELNLTNQKKIDNLKKYCEERIVDEPELDYSIKCKNCGYSLSEINNYIALVPVKENELNIIKAEFIVAPPEPVTGINGGNETPITIKKPRKVQLKGLKKVMTVREYKLLLTEQMRLLVSVEPEEKIELEIEI